MAMATHCEAASVLGGDGVPDVPATEALRAISERTDELKGLLYEAVNKDYRDFVETYETQGELRADLARLERELDSVVRETRVRSVFPKPRQLKSVLFYVCLMSIPFFRRENWQNWRPHQRRIVLSRGSFKGQRLPCVPSPDCWRHMTFSGDWTARCVQTDPVLSSLRA